MPRPLKAAFLVLGLGVTAAAAQPPPDRESFLTDSPAGTLRGSKLIGLPVIGQDHVKIGSIEDLLVDGEGRIQAVLIGVGGFLGVGEKRVAVPYDELALNTGGEARPSGPTSVATPRNAPSAEAARTAGPETMPGAKASDAALDAVPSGRSGTADASTGSAGRQDASRGRATVALGEPVRAEIRMTKAQLQAAPAFDADERK
ncbi:PRC-barrel domain-containing protein [Methylobacterium nigriterrae]|uniref:PRC-barrel domain-containing protein n=1 Tax=Methylobacterium nigriterrae TaxID=3127512 RepID=UPI0030138D33